MNGRIHDLILDPDRTHEIIDIVAESGFYGMQTFDQALLAHVQADRITMEEAIKAATSPHDFKLLVASGGERSTSVEQVSHAA